MAESIRINVIPYFDDNFSYVIQAPNSKDVVIIDCGDSGPIVDYLVKENLSPMLVLLTHSHYDHAGDVDGLKDDFPDVQIVKPKGEDRIKADGLEVGEGDVIPFSGFDIKVSTVPAHTKFCTCYQIENHIFVGDILFSGGCGRLFEGDQEDLYDAMSRFAQMPEEMIVYFGHEYTLQNLSFAKSIELENTALREYEELIQSQLANGKHSTPTTISKEKEINPFLRIDQPGVIDKVDDQGSLTPAQRMGVLRRMKDSF